MNITIFLLCFFRLLSGLLPEAAVLCDTITENIGHWNDRLTKEKDKCK